MTRSLLIVEDDREMLDLLAHRFRRLGYDVVSAGDVQEARAAAATRDFALALLDRRLSGQSGVLLMQELQAQTANLKSIILSGYADPEFEEDALQRGAFAYLRKPCRLAVIEATLQRARDTLS